MDRHYYFLLAAFFFASTGLLAQEVSTLVLRGERSFEAMSWSDDGRIFTPDFANGRLFQINLDGSLDTLVKGLRTPLGGDFDAAGNYYYSEFGLGLLHRYTPAGVDSVIATELGQPSGTYYDAPNDRILVADYTFNRLFAVSLADGAVTTLIGNVPATGLNGPDAVVAAPGGDGYLIANFNDSLIHKLDADGELSLFSFLPGSPQSGYLAPFQNGYLSAGLVDHRIWFIDSSGVATIWAGTGTQGVVDGSRLDTVSFSVPNGIVLSPDGDSLLISENITLGQIRLITGLNQLTGLNQTPLRTFDDFRLFPQPTKDQFITAFSISSSTVLRANLMAADGRLVQAFSPRQITAGDQRETWNLPPDLPAGTYFFQLRSTDGRQYSGSVLVQ